MTMNPAFRIYGSDVPIQNSSRVKRDIHTVATIRQEDNIARIMDSIGNKINFFISNIKDRDSKLLFYYRYHERSIFINLIVSTIFNLIVNPDDTTINFQGANSKVRYFAVNILPISTIYKNIPYYNFPNHRYWTVINIKPRKVWTNNITFFSITPYIGQYDRINASPDEGREYVDYLANVNTAFNSILAKSNNATIFDDDNTEEISIIYTFSHILQKVTNDPHNGVYSFLLPGIFDRATFTFVARFQKKDESKKLSVLSHISAFTFSELPFKNTDFLQIDDNTNLLLENELDMHPRKNTNYESNKTAIDQFISLAKSYDENYTMLKYKIYPYFYLKNNNVVVTNAYQLINSNSDCNALINDYNKNYYNTEIIQLRDGNGNLAVSSLKILAINHVSSMYATESNIQIYNVDTQKSIFTLETSTSLPLLSDKSYPSHTYDVEQTDTILERDIDLTDDIFNGVDQISIFERVSYPVSTFDDVNQFYVNSGPRYTSFSIDNLYEEENSSLTDTVEYVESNQSVYLIKSNNTDFSLSSNFNPYSTMNFRVYGSP